MVEFTPLHIWNIGEENTVEYTLPTGFEEASSDWVGIYKVTMTLKSLLKSINSKTQKSLDDCRRTLWAYPTTSVMSIHRGAKHQTVIIHMIKSFTISNFPIPLIWMKMSDTNFCTSNAPEEVSPVWLASVNHSKLKNDVHHRDLIRSIEFAFEFAHRLAVKRNIYVVVWFVH